MTGVQGRSQFSQDKAGEEIIDIRSLLLMLWRRKSLIIGTFILGLALAGLFLYLTPPRYTANALVMIDPSPRQEHPLNPGPPGRLETGIVLSEIEVMRSRALAMKVIRRLDLMNDPEFNPHYKALGGAAGTFRPAAVSGKSLKNLPPHILHQDMAAAAMQFKRHLNIRLVPGSFAVRVEFTALDPVKAALIANTVIDEYRTQSLESRFENNQKLQRWLDGRLADLRAQLRAAEMAAGRYRAVHNLTEGSGPDLYQSRVAELNTRLSGARAVLADAQGELEQLRRLSKNGGEKINSAALPAGFAQTLQQLRHEKRNILASISDLSQRYGEKHPEMIKQHNALASAESSIEARLMEAGQAAEARLELAQGRVDTLETELEGLSHKHYANHDEVIRLRELESEAESSRLILEAFLERYKRLTGQEQLHEPAARVLSHAAVPPIPAFPNTPLVLSLSAALSLFLGVFLALLTEKMDNTYRSAIQLETATGLPCYGLIPAADMEGRQDAAAHVLEHPSSPLSESVRGLRLLLKMRMPGGGGSANTVAVTSSFQGEGKTTLCVWLGRMAAKAGEKTILVDCDFRRPNVHQLLKCDHDSTLVDYLEGRKNLEEIIHTDSESGLKIISARPAPDKALDLIGGASMKALSEALKRKYDLVIFDCPTALAVSDAKIVSTLAGRTLYVVGWNKTPRQAVCGGIKQFLDIGQRDLALVLNKVDIKCHLRYGYGDSMHYYGHEAKKACAA